MRARLALVIGRGARLRGLRAQGRHPGARGRRRRTSSARPSLPSTLQGLAAGGGALCQGGRPMPRHRGHLVATWAWSACTCTTVTARDPPTRPPLSAYRDAYERNSSDSNLVIHRAYVLVLLGKRRGRAVGSGKGPRRNTPTTGACALFEEIKALERHDRATRGPEGNLALGTPVHGYWAQFRRSPWPTCSPSASPGPDFAMVVRQSLAHGRRAAIWTSIGIGTAILVHVTYALLGIGILLRTSPAAFTAVKFAGAGLPRLDRRQGAHAAARRPACSPRRRASKAAIARPGRARAAPGLGRPAS